MNNLLLKGFELFFRQVKHVKNLTFYLFSLSITQSIIKFFSLYALKLLLKIMANAYDFAVNIVMLINYTINKARNIHDSLKKIIYAASAYDFTVNIVTVINM